MNLIGEHTDYNEGFVLPLAIERGTTAAVARRTDGRLRCLSLEEGAAPDVDLADAAPGRAHGWAAYVHGVAWALRAEGFDVGGADVAVSTTLAIGGGLSSSAALACSVAVALAELYAIGANRVALARAARRAENEVVGVPTGPMDQLASLLARGGHALLVDTRSLELRHVPLPLDGHARLLVIDTRASRRLADGAYADRRAACEAAAKVLGVRALRDATLADVEAAAPRLGDVGYRRARHVVTENERVTRTVEALDDGRLADVGALLDASHRSLRHDYDVSSRELDAAVDAAVAAGAYGARLTGAGFGGCALALVPAERARDVERDVRARFEAERLGEPDVFAVTASSGACRLA